MTEPQLLPPCVMHPPPAENRNYRWWWFDTQARALRSSAYRFFKSKDGRAKLTRSYWHDYDRDLITIDTGDADCDQVILDSVLCGKSPGDVACYLEGIVLHRDRNNQRAKELIALFAAAGAKADARLREFLHPSCYSTTQGE